MNYMKEEWSEPQLTYWKPAPVTITPPESNYSPLMGVLPVYSQYPVVSPLPTCHPHLPAFTYSSPDIVHSYIQNQATGCQSLTDTLVHHEITRAAKSMFSKRNSTLLHWLNPGVNKKRLKADIDAAWDSLPSTEKVYYFSQVLGKFGSNTTTNLMINSQLNLPGNDRLITTAKPEGDDEIIRLINEMNTDDGTNTSTDSGSPLDVRRVRRRTSELKVSKSQATVNHTARPPQKIKAENRSDDEASCDSGLVMDIEINKQLKEPDLVPRVKRKYVKRKHQQINPVDGNVGTSSSDNCKIPVNINDVKVELNSEHPDPPVPRVKRKYVKRKLERKKYEYKKREPKSKLVETKALSTKQDPMIAGIGQEPESSTKQDGDNLEEMDIWIDLENNSDLCQGIDQFNLFSKEVDNFWDSIENPNSLFQELDIV